MSSKPKLLIIELWGLGDLVIATPFIRAAAEKFQVTLLAKSYAKVLQKRFWPGVNVVTFNAPWTAFTGKYRLWSWPWREIFQLRKLLRYQFEIGLSARWDPRDHLLLTMLGVRRRLGFPRIGSQFFLTEPLERPGDQEHHYEFWRLAAKRLEFELPEAKQLTEPLPLTRTLVLIHTGARLPARIWPLENYRKLAVDLRAAGWEVQIACDRDQSEWWNKVAGERVVCPRSVEELLSTIDTAGVFIGNCSAPGHLAAISGVPTFTIFGPSLPEWFAPLHPAADWIEGKPCPYKPCSDYCRFEKPVCMHNLTEEEVWPRVKAFVSRHVPAAIAAV